MNIDPKILELVGEIDFDPKAIEEKYAHERDVRLRPDGNDQFIEVTADFSHYIDDPYCDPEFTRAPLSDEVEVAVIGGGFGGILAGARLRQAGIASIRIIEKAGDFGGCWYWNRYPGIHCDTESYVYMPLLEETGFMPSYKYSPGREIRNHIKGIAKKYDLYRDVCFQTAVTELRWNDGTSKWTISTDRDDSITAQFVVMGNGPLDRPKLPGVPGINEFKGHTFHTSRWDYAYTGGDENGNLEKLKDKRVGIVGTGATGVQCIPHLGQWAGKLYVFQRTPAAVDVRANRPTTDEWSRGLKSGWQEERIENFNRVVTGIPQDIDLVDDGFTQVGRLLDPTATWAESIIGRPLTEDEGEFVNQILDDKKMNELRTRIDEVVLDPKTAEALKPWHRRWCKRPLFSDDYLPTFNNPNVTLVDTCGRGVERFTESAAIVDEQAYELDCLIFATGFEVGTAFTRRAGYEIYGTQGVQMSEDWKDGMRTFQGVYARGFPNCMIMGFGQNAAATNFVFILDEQSKHIAYSISEARKRGATTIEPTAKAVDDYVAEVNPLSFAQLKFWVECTPSYFNGEGDSANPHGFFANVHPAGTVGFYDMLREWRAAGKLEGLELK